MRPGSRPGSWLRGAWLVLAPTGVVACAAAPADLDGPSVRSALESIRPAVLGAHMRFLADDLLENSVINAALQPAFAAREKMAQAQIKQVQPTLLFPTKFRDVKIHTVRVPGLSLVYRLAGLEYGQGFAPVFVVSSDHERHERLLEQLTPEPAVEADHV